MPAARFLVPICETLPVRIAWRAEALQAARRRRRRTIRLGRGETALPCSEAAESLPLGHKMPTRRHCEPRIRNRRTIGKSKAGLSRRYRNLAMEQIGTRQLSACRDTEALVRAAEAIAKSRHRAATHIGVAIHSS